MEAPDDIMARLSRDLHELALHVQNEGFIGDDHPLRPLVDRYAAVEPPTQTPADQLTMGQKIAEGLAIIMRYEGDTGFAAEHDEVWFGGPVAHAKMTQADHKRLRDLGWLWVAQFDSWRHFV